MSETVAGPTLLYGYGIVDNNGEPYIGDCCVGERLDMESQVDCLNDEPEAAGYPYRVVALYYSEIG